MMKKMIRTIAVVLVMAGSLAAAGCLRKEAAPPEPEPMTDSSPSVKYFLKVDGVEGDSMAPGHPKEIEVEAFGWRMHTATAIVGSKASFEDFIVFKPADVTSPVLLVKAASGEHLARVTFTVQRQAELPFDVLTYRFSDVVVRSIEQTGNLSRSHLPLEEVAFSYAKIEVEYLPLDPDGTLGEPIRGGWDLARNVKI